MQFSATLQWKPEITHKSSNILKLQPVSLRSNVLYSEDVYCFLLDLHCIKKWQISKNTVPVLSSTSN